MLDPDVLIEEAVNSKFPDQESSQECIEYRGQVEEQIKLQSSAFNSSGQLWDDGIVLPQHTRKVSD